LRHSACASPGSSTEAFPLARREADDATRGSAIKLAAELIGRPLGLATSFLVARALGVSDFGVFGKFWVIAVIAAEAADLGLQGTASRALVARTVSLAAIVRAKSLLTAALVLPAAAAFFFWPVLVPLLVYFVVAGWSELLGVALRARGHRTQEAVVIFCLRLAGLVLVAAAVSRGAGLVGVTWALALSTLAPVALGFVLVRRLYAAEPRGANDPGTPGLLRESAPLAVNGGLALLSLRVEFLAVSLLRGTTEAGLFFAALKVVEFLNIVPQAVSAGAMPALTREAMQGRGPVRKRTATTAALLAAPAALGLMLVAPGLVTLVFGAEFAPAARPLSWMALSLLPLFLNGVQTHALIAAERASWLPRLTAIRVLVATVVAWIVVPAYGALGAAAGFVLSEVLLLGLGARACAAARFPVPVFGPVLRGLAVALPMAAAVGAAGLGFALSVVLGLLVYGITLALAWRLRVDVLGEA
jgi:O-antigen/teichoic acid export membrane protein